MLHNVDHAGIRVVLYVLEIRKTTSEDFQEGFQTDTLLPQTYDIADAIFSYAETETDAVAEASNQVYLPRMQQDLQRSRENLFEVRSRQMRHLPFRPGLELGPSTGRRSNNGSRGEITKSRGFISSGSCMIYPQPGFTMQFYDI